MKRSPVRLGWVLGLALGSMSAATLAAPPASPTRARSSAKKPPVAEHAPYLVTGVELHVGDGSVLENATIVVRDGRFEAVGGPELAAKYDAGYARIDLAGKIVTPGFIAAHTSLTLEEIGAERSTVDSHVERESYIRAGYDPAAAVNAESSLLRVQAVEGVTTAAVTPFGGLLSGGAVWVALVQGDFGGLVVARRIAIAGRLGQSVEGNRAASLQRLREVLEDADFYAKNARSFDRGQSRPLAADPADLEALGPVLDGERPLVLAMNRASDILGAIELAEEFGIELVIVGGAEGWKVAKQIADAKATVVVMPSTNLPSSFDQLGARLDNAALLHAAGVSIVIAQLGEPHNVRNMKQEAGIAIANGLDREAAVVATTLNVARAYGMDAEYGSVATTKVANFVVWEHDPFELDSFPERVFIRGVDTPLVSRQSLLRDRYMERLDLGR